MINNYNSNCILYIYAIIVSINIGINIINIITIIIIVKGYNFGIIGLRHSLVALSLTH